MNSIEEVIEKKIVEVLLNNTKLRLIMNQQMNKNELDDSSIIAITILIYLLALLISYYSILLYQNININIKSTDLNNSASSISSERKRKRRMTKKSANLSKNTTKKRNIDDTNLQIEDNT